MPYTLAHPGFVLPLRKKWLPWFPASAVIAGSVVPDLDILFRLSNARFHLYHFTLPEIFLLQWPMALMLAFLLQRWIIPYYTASTCAPLEIKSAIGTLGVMLIHLCLDGLVHRDAYSEALKIFGLWNLQRTDHLVMFQWLQLTIQYLPQVVVTAIGFAAIYLYEGGRVKTVFMRLYTIQFFRPFTLIVILYLMLRWIFCSFEAAFYFDQLILTGTGAVLLAAALVPLGTFLYQFYRTHVS